MLKRVWRSAKPLVFFILFLTSLAGLLGIGASDVAGAVKSVSRFLSSTNPFVLLLTMGLLYLSYMYWKRQGNPLTIVSSDLKFFLEDEDASRVESHQSYRLRAHRPDVRAYYQEFHPGPGRIPEESLGCWISHCDSTKHTYGDENGWEIVQRFDEPIPARIPIPLWWMTYIPKLRDFLTVGRVFEATALNSLPDNSRYIEVGTERYPHRNITISIYFPNGAERPPRDQWSAYRVRKEAMLEIPIQPTRSAEGREGMRVTVESSQDEKIRIAW